MRRARVAQLMWVGAGLLVLQLSPWGDALEALTVGWRLALRGPAPQEAPVTMIVHRGERDGDPELSYRRALVGSMTTLREVFGTSPDLPPPAALIIDGTLTQREEAGGDTPLGDLLLRVMAPLEDTSGEGERSWPVVTSVLLTTHGEERADPPGYQPLEALRALRAHGLGGGPISLGRVVGHRLPYPSLSADLLKASTAVGFTTIPRELAEGPLYRIQADLLYDFPELRGEPREPARFLFLPIVGAAVALCGEMPLSTCVERQPDALLIQGDAPRRLALDGGERLWISHRPAFLWPQAPHVDPLDLEEECRRAPTGQGSTFPQARPLDVVQFHLCGDGRGWFSSGDGGARVAPEWLSGRALLFVDGRERPGVRYPVMGGGAVHPASVHAQILASILTDDLLSPPPPLSGLLAALVLLGLSLPLSGSAARRGVILRLSGLPAYARLLGFYLLQGLLRPEVLLAGLWGGACVVALRWGVLLPLGAPLFALGLSAFTSLLRLPMELQRMAEALRFRRARHYEVVEALRERTDALAASRITLSRLMAESEAHLALEALHAETCASLEDARARARSLQDAQEGLRARVSRMAAVLDETRASAQEVLEAQERVEMLEAQQLEQGQQLERLRSAMALGPEEVSRIDSALAEARSALQRAGAATSQLTLSPPPQDVALGGLAELQTEMARLRAELFELPPAAAKGSTVTIAELEAWVRYGGALREWLLEVARASAQEARVLAERIGEPAPPEPPRSGRDQEDAQWVGLDTSDPELHQMCARIRRRYGPSGEPVLLEGESGVGKERIAHALHRASLCAEGPWVAVNCATIPSGVQESILFGHERGAFTGAGARAKGLFEQANGGTLFIDEGHRLSHKLQEQLLRVIETGEVVRLGGSHQRPVGVSVRIIFGCKPGLRELVEEMHFLPDLYFRLSVIRVILPPLRERPEVDVFDLFRLFLKERVGSVDGDVVIEPGVRSLLRMYRWPGNVRELENFVRALCVELTGPTVPYAMAQRLLRARMLSPPETVHAETGEAFTPDLEEVLSPSEVSDLRMLRRHRLSGVGCASDPEHPAMTEKTANRRLVILVHRSLFVGRWDLDAAACALAGADRSLVEVALKRLNLMVSRLRKRVETEEPGALAERIRAQYGLSADPVLETVDAIQRGEL